MAIPRKRSKKNLYIALLLIVILSVSVAAAAYAFWPRAVVGKAGVHVGDSFTYSITGSVSLQSPDATVAPGFEQYNQTDYYKVSVTDVNGPMVSLDTLWAFKNGTQVTGQQTINLTDGSQSVDNGFWAIYSANLNVGDRLRPTDNRYIVNATDTQPYADSTRQRNFWFIENEFYDVNDPTQSTLRDVYNGIYFDKQTGMLLTLNSISYYNNPLRTEVITWQLVNCTVWAV